MGDMTIITQCLEGYANDGRLSNERRERIKRLIAKMNRPFEMYNKGWVHVENYYHANKHGQPVPRMGFVLVPTMIDDLTPGA
jgi:hypothetical protein